MSAQANTVNSNVNAPSVDVVQPTAIELAMANIPALFATVDTLTAQGKATTEASKEVQAQLVSLFSPLNVAETQQVVASLLKRASDSFASLDAKSKKAKMQTRVRSLTRAINKTLPGDTVVWSIKAHPSVVGLYMVESENKANDIEKVIESYNEALGAMLALGLLNTARRAIVSARQTQKDSEALLASLI